MAAMNLLSLAAIQAVPFFLRKGFLPRSPGTGAIQVEDALANQRLDLVLGAIVYDEIVSVFDLSAEWTDRKEAEPELET
jgi:hypothetical protein